MNHLDLFSGIGGFAYAVDQVWPGARHTFCEIDPFCQKVLAKHWPESEIYGDIRTIKHTKSNRLEGKRGKGTFTKSSGQLGLVDLLTGGFPCQPFSTASNKRRGTEDDRYLWPEMLRVIKLTQPEWIIGENVYGLINIQEGMVLEQVCTDLENEGYEVQPLIIPACSVNAPHRRDRVWIVAHKSGKGLEGIDWIQGERCTQTNWNKDWLEVAAELCSLDDGLPIELGEFKLSKAQHRNEQIKAYGNSIVPQVAMEIMKAIKYAN